ncbi:MAG: response regulator [Anaerolineae bacterium]|jgi:CheY-like chemotaxis protein
MSKILIIDDDPDFLYTVRLVLEDAGFEVETASTPEQGLGKVQSTEPDLVILDVLMPSEYEGFAVASAIREELHITDLPIVMLTAVHDIKRLSHRFAPDDTYLPVDVFLDKPIELDSLVQIINEVLGQRREEPKHPL